MKTSFRLVLRAFPVAFGLVLALAGCTPETRDCAASSIMLRVKCANGIAATSATASLTRLEGGRVKELPLAIDCSRVSNIQVNIPDYAAEERFDIVVQAQDEGGAPVGAPALITNLPLAQRCTAVDIILGVEMDAAMPDPDPMPKMDTGPMNTGGSDGDGGTDAEEKRADGVECSNADECRSGFCVDGICCVGACDGQCEACNVEGKEGSCVPVQGEPRNQRPACSGMPPCKGSCDGENAKLCAYPKGPEHTCGAAPSCDGNTALAKAQCDGTGACGQPERVACEGFLCDATKGTCSQCSNSMPCGTGQWCRNGKCEAKLGNGMACNSGENSCVSGHCANGVCCNNACSGPCETCSAAGQCGNRCVAPQTCGGGGTQNVCGCNPSCGGKCGGADGCGGTCPNNCVAPQMCGAGGTANVCGCIPNCTGKCGGSNGCGGTCANNCVAPQTCGGAGTNDVCGCIPNCTGKCGGSNGCGGTCASNCVAPQTCGGGGTADVCGCTPNCAGKCGGSNGCGGTCANNCVAPQTCGGSGTTNVCGCPAVAGCSAEGKFCSQTNVITCGLVNGCLAQTMTSPCTGECQACSSGACNDVCSTLDLTFQQSISGRLGYTDFTGIGGHIGYSATTATSAGSCSAGEAFGNPGEFRAYLSFDMGAIGAGRQIKSAILSLSEIAYGNSSGVGDPFGYGPLWIEGIDYGTSLDSTKADFDVPSNWFKEVSKTQAPSFSIDVLPAVAEAYSLRSRVQFRLRFINLKGSNGIGMFIPANNIKLTVRSRLP